MIKRRKKNEADDFMASWNAQFSCDLEIYALRYLYKDYNENELSTVTTAISHMSELNSALFRVMTELLTEIKHVAHANTEAVVHTNFVGSHHFSWNAVTLPQVSQMVERMFSNLNLDDLVRKFLSALLSESGKWIENGVDVTSFLEDYLEANLREITDTGLDRYLEEAYVATGCFASLDDALCGPKGLFNWLKTQAKHLFLSNKSYQSSYHLSVPGSCTKIAQAAAKYCKENKITLQLSSVRSRICMQSVACVIPLFDYSEIQRYENAYHNASQQAQAGRHLRAFWSRHGQVSAPAGTENWFKLPSPVPARIRGGASGACPEAVKTVEASRRQLFRDLVNTPVIRFDINVNDSGDVDCRFYHSRPWAQCGIQDILGYHDANLMSRGNLDSELVRKALETLKDLRNGGLPAADGILDTTGVPMKKISDILLQCWKQADEADKKAAAKVAGIDADQFKQLKDAACRRIAEEYFISSMPLCMWGELELEKYQKLDTEIQRLTELSAKLGTFSSDCRSMAMLFITDTVKETTNHDNKSCFAFLNEKQVWDADSADLFYSDSVICEYQLYLRLMEMKANANIHVVDSFRKILKLGEERFDLVKAKKVSADVVAQTLKNIANLLELCSDHVRDYRDNLKRSDTGSYGIYDERGLKFYDTMATEAELLDKNLRRIYRDELEPAPVKTADAQTDSAAGWTCPECGEKDIQKKFCPECGCKKPEPKQGWTCPECGEKDIQKKFCPECGYRKPEPKQGWTCPECGEKDIQKKFCPECGYRKPDAQSEAKLGWNCPECGEKNIQAKFCPECGYRKPGGRF